MEARTNYTDKTSPDKFNSIDEIKYEPKKFHIFNMLWNIYKAHYNFLLHQRKVVMISFQPINRILYLQYCPRGWLR